MIEPFKRNETILDAMNMSKRTSDDDKTLYSQLVSYKDFVWYMLGVVKQKLTDPNYGWERNENSDNDWWQLDDPRYIMLQDINRKGLATINGEEGDKETHTPIDPYWKEEGVIAWNFRCALILYCPKQYCEAFVKYMVAHDIIVLLAYNLKTVNASYFISTGYAYFISTGYAVNNVGLQVNAGTSMGVLEVPDYTTTSIKSSDYEKIARTFKWEIHEKTMSATGKLNMTQQAVQFTVVDPVYNRRSFDEGGLYKTILDFLNDTPDLVEKFGVPI